MTPVGFRPTSRSPARRSPCAWSHRSEQEYHQFHARWSSSSHFAMTGRQDDHTRATLATMACNVSDTLSQEPCGALPRLKTTMYPAGGSLRTDQGSPGGATQYREDPQRSPADGELLAMRLGTACAKVITMRLVVEVLLKESACVQQETLYAARTVATLVHPGS